MKINHRFGIQTNPFFRFFFLDLDNLQFELMAPRVDSINEFALWLFTADKAIQRKGEEEKRDIVTGSDPSHLF